MWGKTRYSSDVCRAHQGVFASSRTRPKSHYPPVPSQCCLSYGFTAFLPPQSPHVVASFSNPSSSIAAKQRPIKSRKWGGLSLVKKCGNQSRTMNGTTITSSSFEAEASNAFASRFSNCEPPSSALMPSPLKTGRSTVGAPCQKLGLPNKPLLSENCGGLLVSRKFSLTQLLESVNTSQHWRADVLDKSRQRQTTDHSDQLLCHGYLNRHSDVFQNEYETTTGHINSMTSNKFANPSYMRSPDPFEVPVPSTWNRCITAERRKINLQPLPCSIVVKS